MNLEKNYQKILRRFIRKNKNKISAFLRGDLVDYSKSDFNFFEFNEGFYVTVNKLASGTKDKAVKFNLGFPFPVCSLDKKMSVKYPQEFHFYFKGEELRQEQRKILKNYFKTSRTKPDWKEISGLAKFRQEFDSNIRRFHSENILYSDPYNFIGDSFIGMHFTDALMSKYSFSDRIIFSRSCNDLSVLGETYDHDLVLLKELFSRYHCLVLPDLLDVNFAKTLAIISALSDQNGLIVIPGRALFVRLNKGKINFFHLNQPDTILRNQNIEDYMNECLRPFIDPSQACQAAQFNGDNRVFFINPFGSRENKTIDLNFVLALCQELNRLKKVKINIIGGLRDCTFHAQWVKEFAKLALAKKINHKISYYSSLNQLVLDIHKLRPGAILTTDTSISHLANRLNIPTIIFFHARRFDNRSLQSMISESPLGFGRYFKNSYPVLIRNYTKELPATINNFLRLIAESGYKISGRERDKFLRELRELFPLEYFYQARPASEHKKIKKMLEKVSPLNKLKI